MVGNRALVRLLAHACGVGFPIELFMRREDREFYKMVEECHKCTITKFSVLDAITRPLRLTSVASLRASVEGE